MHRGKIYTSDPFPLEEPCLDSVSMSSGEVSDLEEVEDIKKTAR
jgi:hypothetical protein